MQGRLYEFGEPDQLLLNDGKGRFTSAELDQRRFPG